ncbi:MAG: hypothetical protein PHY80_01985 [Rickettsiales bacterium]|nr:hypothetical protein [Rickettsiales bacterium]
MTDTIKENDFAYNNSSDATPLQVFLSWLFGEGKMNEENWKALPTEEQDRKQNEAGKGQEKRLVTAKKKLRVLEVAAEFGVKGKEAMENFYKVYQKDPKFREHVDKYIQKQDALEKKIDSKVNRIVELKQIANKLKEDGLSEDKKKALRLRAAKLCYERSKGNRFLDVVTLGLRKKWQKSHSGATDSDIRDTLRTEERKFAIMTGKRVGDDLKLRDLELEGRDSKLKGRILRRVGISLTGRYSSRTVAQRLMDNGHIGLGKGQKVLRQVTAIESEREAKKAAATMLPSLKGLSRQQAK